MRCEEIRRNSHSHEQMNSNESIGKRIQRLRKDKGMTQEELARAVGVSSQAVSKWENGYSCPDISILTALAAALGVSSDELLDGSSCSNSNDATKEEFVPAPDSKASGKSRGHFFGYGKGSIGGKIWLGLFIIFAGVMLILTKATHIVPFGFFAIIWPSFLICGGLSELCKRHINIFSVGMTLFGAYFLLCNIEVVPKDFHGKWVVIAIILIICGLSALMPKRFRLKMPHGTHSGASGCGTDGYIDVETSFCEDKCMFDGGMLRGGSVDVSFGSVTLDLTTLDAVAENASIDLDVSFGSLTVLLPKSVRIIDDRDASFGSVNIRGNAAEDAAFLLTVNSDVSFGSLDIRYF